METDNSELILGAIAGDIIGSVYEHCNIKRTDFPLFLKSSDFTDDSVLTVATMKVLLENKGYTEVYQAYSRRYEGRGYGDNYYLWIYSSDPKPYNSWGNGSAMRASPVGYAFDSLERVMQEAKRSAEVTHNHPEGIRGAQATAVAVFLARTGSSKKEIREYISSRFGYDLNRTTEEIRPGYTFDISCQGTVPEAIIAFLESMDFENAIRLAVSLGGDSDTLACITGSIAQAFYKTIPEHIAENCLKLLPGEMIRTISAFSKKYGETV